MPHILKNDNLELIIDLPLENYNFTRFDWTGKIRSVNYRDIYLSGIERTDAVNEHHIGKGFYNEFGIDSPIGFETTRIGEWFHKIGVGLLKKETDTYDFFKNHELIPANFTTEIKNNKLLIGCKSELINGYCYELKKEIVLNDSDFVISYQLINTGEKDIITDEYLHNFIAIDNDLISENYELNFLFKLKPSQFIETVNTENMVVIDSNSFKFNGIPKEPFFFSNLSGDSLVDASWELKNIAKKISISEKVSFKTNKINLWGWEHVISPELFYKINLKPGETANWNRIIEVKSL